MKKEKVSEIIAQIDEKYIDEATLFAAEAQEAVTKAAVKPEKAGRKAKRFRWGLAAACLAAVLLLGSGAFALRAEAKEYRSALMFFEENGLSAEGLSRAEIKAVYRDITTKSFTYGKTAEVIRQAVPGWEIDQKEPTPEEIAQVWQQKTQAAAVDTGEIDPAIDPRLGPGIRYIREEVHRETWNEQTGSFEKSVLKCYRDRQLIWTAEFTDFLVGGCEHFPEGTVVWGQTISLSSAQKSFLWLAFVDDSGQILWQRRYDHAFMDEYAAAVLENDDGSWAVISRGDLKFVCLICVDRDGRELSFRKTEVGNLGIWNAARLGDGYILHLVSYLEGDYAHLYRMDRKGNLTENFFYEGDDCVYHIVDMAEFGGQVYLSAYAVPKQDTPGYGREEIYDILDYAFNKMQDGWEYNDGLFYFDDELTRRVRDNYTAVLLICDPAGGAAKTFWSVKGSLGGKLSVNDSDQMEWDVESIFTTFYSPMTSSFSIGGSCTVFRYTFNEAGSLIGQTETGETTGYHR